MSTDIQLKGDSRRRQLEASERFAADHSLDLQQGFRLEDIGVSAFKGHNVSSGALGRFLEAVRAGKIEPGSYLLVESLDRLSRQDILASLSIFTGLLGAGIHIATIGDGHLYKAGQTDVSDLIFSLVIMARAHEESVTKSKRVGAAWSNKRANIARHKLTALTPAWLKLSSDRNGFEVVGDRAATVREIFELSAAGLGSFSITKRLNETGQKPFGRSHGWQISYVSKILGNRAVLGEFQPHVLRDGKRVPAGDSVADYFPQIVSQELFNRAQRSQAQRKVGGGGRRGTGTSNLFSRVAKCGYCGAQMHFVNKGAPPKGGTYLVCDVARRGLGCEKTGWTYPEFEASFLAFVRELDLEALLANTDQAGSRNELQQKLQSLDGRIGELQMRRERTYELISDGRPSDFIRQKLEEIEAEITETEIQRSALDETLSAKIAEAGRLYESKDQIKGLIDRVRAGGDETAFLARASIAARLKDLVEQLRLFPSGLGPILRKAANDAADESLEPLRRWAEAEDERRKCFVIALKGGLVRIVYPDATDPIQYLEISELSADKFVVAVPGKEPIVIDTREQGVDWDLSFLLGSVSTEQR